MKPALRWTVLALIAALWVSSLALPAAEIGGGVVLRGRTLLARGWQGSEAGVFAWYANPLFLGALLASGLRLHRAATVLSGLSLLLALTSFAAEELARARGMAVPELSFRAGFFIWLAAMLLLAAWTGTCALVAGRGSSSTRYRRDPESRD